MMGKKIKFAQKKRKKVQELMEAVCIKCGGRQFNGSSSLVDQS